MQVIFWIIISWSFFTVTHLPHIILKEEKLWPFWRPVSVQQGIFWQKIMRENKVGPIIFLITMAIKVHVIQRLTIFHSRPHLCQFIRILIGTAAFRIIQMPQQIQTHLQCWLRLARREMTHRTMLRVESSFLRPKKSSDYILLEYISWQNNYLYSSYSVSTYSSSCRANLWYVIILQYFDAK